MVKDFKELKAKEKYFTYIKLITLIYKLFNKLITLSFKKYKLFPSFYIYYFHPFIKVKKDLIFNKLCIKFIN
jgi:hypothetical protein